LAKPVAPRAWTLAAATLVALGLASLVARADAGAPESFRLVWVRGERTESCEDGPAMARSVSARLGRDVFTPSASRSIEGVIQHEGQHWEAHVYVRDERGKLVGSRDILNDGPDCASLDAAVTLAIALTIDPEAALRPPPPSAAPMTVTAPAPVPTASTPVPVATNVCPPAPPPPPPPPCPLERPCPTTPGPLPSRSESIVLTLRGLVAGGLLPGASPGMGLAVDLPVYRALHGTAGMFLLPETQDSTARFAFGLTAGWLGPCVEPVRGWRGALSACAKLELGAIHSVVLSKLLVPTEPGDRFWAGGSASLEGRLRLVGPLVAEAGAELFLPIPRQQFSILGQANAVFTESAPAGAGFVGLGVTIP
jgi:hypothetical protein